MLLHDHIREDRIAEQASTGRRAAAFVADASIGIGIDAACERRTGTDVARWMRVPDATNGLRKHLGRVGKVF